MKTTKPNDRVLMYIHKNVTLNKHGLFSGYAYGVACPLSSAYYWSTNHVCN